METGGFETGGWGGRHPPSVGTLCSPLLPGALQLFLMKGVPFPRPHPGLSLSGHPDWAQQHPRE